MRAPCTAALVSQAATEHTTHPPHFQPHSQSAAPVDTAVHHSSLSKILLSHPVTPLLTAVCQNRRLCKHTLLFTRAVCLIVTRSHTAVHQSSLPCILLSHAVTLLFTRAVCLIFYCHTQSHCCPSEQFALYSIVTRSHTAVHQSSLPYILLSHAVTLLSIRAVCLIFYCHTQSHCCPSEQFALYSIVTRSHTVVHQSSLPYILLSHVVTLLSIRAVCLIFYCHTQSHCCPSEQFALYSIVTRSHTAVHQSSLASILFSHAVTLLNTAVHQSSLPYILSSHAVTLLDTAAHQSSLPYILLSHC